MAQVWRVASSAFCLYKGDYSCKRNRFNPLPTNWTPPRCSAALAWLERNDWIHEQRRGYEESWISAGVSCDNGKWRLIAKVNEELRQAYFWALLDMNIPEDRRLAVAEFITRANFGKRIGFFEMDWIDGEIRFNVSFCVADGELTDAQIEHTVDCALTVMDLHFVALMSVIYGGCEPVDALSTMRDKAAVKPDGATAPLH
jgi:hypothetical protein